MVLELIMGGPVESVLAQVRHSTLFSKDFRYVRSDVYVSDVANVFYDMEMQSLHKEGLSKRTRYHRAELGTTFLELGEKS